MLTHTNTRLGMHMIVIPPLFTCAPLQTAAQHNAARAAAAEPPEEARQRAMTEAPAALREFIKKSGYLRFATPWPLGFLYVDRHPCDIKI